MLSSQAQARAAGVSARELTPVPSITSYIGCGELVAILSLLGRDRAVVVVVEWVVWRWDLAAWMWDLGCGRWEVWGWVGLGWVEFS